MFVFSANLTKKRMIIGVVSVGILLVAAILIVSLFKAGAMVPSYGKAGNEAERLAFSRSFGWEVDESSVEVNDIVIPKVFDDVYTRYNDLQLSQGLDLRTLAGKQVEHFSYIITNYPTGEKNVRINLLVYKSRVVGGDVMSPALDGFMHGFDMG